MVGDLRVVRRAVLRLAGLLRALVERVELALRAVPEAVFAVVDLAVLRFAVDRLAVEDLVARPLLLPVESEASLIARLALLAALATDELACAPPERTRCAASATASAISEPSLVALVTIELAAFWAVSAASIPASRILRRAVGLALIAAAAAARPAASISLLIAALAIFSIVSLVLLLVLRPEDLLRLPELLADERLLLLPLLVFAFATCISPT